MRFELTHLEELFVQKVSPGDNKKQKDEKIKSVEKETKRIKEAFMAELFSEKSKAVLQSYIQVHQKALLDFAGELYNNGQASKKIANSNAYELYAWFSACTEDLLTFLEKHYKEYLSLECEVTVSIKEKAVSDIALKISLIEVELKRCKVDQKLMDTVIQPLNEFIDDTNKITYGRWFFINEMVAGLLSLPEQNKRIINSPKAIVEILCHVNFNSTTFYFYCKDQITAIIGQKESPTDQLYKLTRLQKYFSKLQSKPGLSYNPKSLDISTMLSDWLQDMIALKERELQPSQGTPGFDSEEQKVISSLTVQELGLVTRLCIESGVFRNKNKKALARFMAKNVVTYRKSINEDFSADHIYTAMYTTNETTLDTMQAMLNRMLKALEKVRDELLKKKSRQGNN